MQRRLALIALFSFLAVAAEKPRVLVLTDISNEPDDEESLVRFLVYANEYDVEGLVATTSVWLRSRTRPDIIRETIGAYGKVQPMLSQHAAGFPEAGALLTRVKDGSHEFGMAGVGDGKATEGSRFIIDVADRPDPRPLWIPVWGGANTLAQALWDVKYSRSDEELRRFVAKLRVYSISDQDNAGRWLRITFPDLFYIVSPSAVDSSEYYLATWTGISGDRHYSNGPMVDFELVDNPWLERNIINNHGPLGARYPKLAYIMEGDTPSFLNLIQNGLAGDQDPSWGGWGGRYERRQSYGETRPIWTNSRDKVTAPDGQAHTTNNATIWRWRQAFQHDFAARMDWCVATKAKANHNPALTVNGVAGKDFLRIEAKPGDTVNLEVAATDPDGHPVTVRSFVYREAGTHRGAVSIENHRLIAPKVNRPETLHVIVEAKDGGDPALFAYRRVIVTVRPQ